MANYSTSPVGILGGLGMGMPSPSAESLGANQDIINRARMDMFKNKIAQRQQDFGDMAATSAHATGPLFDPNSELILQGLKEAGVGKVQRGTPSPIFSYERNRR